MPINKHEASPAQVTNISQFLAPTVHRTGHENLAEIRQGLNELRELISPKPSIILTGQRVVDEYWEITNQK